MDSRSNQVALVVEDSAVQRAHMVALVQSLQLGTVLEARDGVDALRVLDNYGKNQIFLVLTDLDMPGMDGIELIRHLGEHQLAENVIVTSARDPRLLEVIEDMGLSDGRLHLLGTVLKPVALEDLTVMLKRVDQIKHAHAVAPDHVSSTLPDLEAALEQKQFIPYFQPKVAIASGVVNGVETLARWQHPIHGVLPPFQFIPIIEGTPLMAPFTLAIIDQALRQLNAWRRLGHYAITVSINLSAETLADSHFIGRVDALVNSHGAAPASLVWEVTETMVMSHLSECLANLARLRLKGYGLAMDDYGIGYSSMQQLSRCPFTELKIDRAFVYGASERPNRRAILESSIEVGHRLGTTTVAEGVESLRDWNLLQELSCDVAQGYLIAKPMPADDFPNWIRENRVRLRSLAASGASKRLHRPERSRTVG